MKLLNLYTYENSSQSEKLETWTNYKTENHERSKLTYIALITGMTFSNLFASLQCMYILNFKNILSVSPNLSI